MFVGCKGYLFVCCSVSGLQPLLPNEKIGKIPANINSIWDKLVNVQKQGIEEQFLSEEDHVTFLGDPHMCMSDVLTLPQLTEKEGVLYVCVLAQVTVA